MSRELDCEEGIDEVLLIGDTMDLRGVCWRGRCGT